MSEQIILRGGTPLHGSVNISGMKNAALPILFATILTGAPCILDHIPPVSDIAVTFDILRAMGGSVRSLGNDSYEIDTSCAEPGKAPDHLVHRLRGSAYLLGAELGRFGQSAIGYPGGCDFGNRPLDLHFKGLERLGATVCPENGRIRAFTDPEKGLIGNSFRMDFASVGATANLMMAAVKADGITVIENAAREPHIADLAGFLNAAGAKICGAGTDRICVEGVRDLHGCRYGIIPDMIEAGTYLVAGAASGGCVRVCGVNPRHLRFLTDVLQNMGADLLEGSDSVTLCAEGKRLRGTDLETAPYPGFPTDMHPQFAALLCTAAGGGRIRETVWGNRFRYAEELRKFGGDITVEGDSAVIRNSRLHGARARATDLRAGAALVIAGLCADGMTVLSDAEYIGRGYADLIPKLKSLGANIHQ